MPEPKKITKAILQEIGWDKSGKVNHEGRQMKVQFNPESLKVTFSNQVAGGNQAGGSAIQFSGRGTTKLSFDLWFDVTDPNIATVDEAYKDVTDVRRITKQVSDFMKPKEIKRKGKVTYVPPGVKFFWGSFLFEGVMESLNETLEFFSEDGKPLRASVSIGITKQDIDVKFLDNATASRQDSSPGTERLTPSMQNDTMHKIAAREGNPEDWQELALANNIENPRSLSPGTPLNLRARLLKSSLP